LRTLFALSGRGWDNAPRNAYANESTPYPRIIRLP